MVRGEELPAQWQDLSLKTQQELIAGRRSLKIEDVLSTWADSGEAWLRGQFINIPDLEFHTKWDTTDLTITLEVFRNVAQKHPNGVTSHWPELLFTETCKAENFVTRLMVTKIMMVA